MEQNFNFTGKTILITGASSGIGKETSVYLSKLGAKILMISLDLNELEQTSLELSGESHAFYNFDLSEILGIEGLINKIIKDHGPVDGFVHCAGIGAVRPLSLSKYDFMLKVMNINFFSYVEIIRCITKRKFYNPGLNIVGISAVGAFQGNSTKTAYNSSKAAMNSATRSLAKELAGKKIRVNTVAPGVTQTAMYDDFLKMDIDSDNYRSITQRQYLGICQPIDIAYTIAFLLSEMSRMITGSCIGVDGGKLTS